MKLTDLSQLGKAVAAQRLQQVLAGADASQRTALEELAAIGFGLVPPRKRPELATRYYTNAKADLGRGELTAVIGSLQAAHDLAPENNLFATRLRLLRRAVKLRSPLPWRANSWQCSVRDGTGRQCGDARRDDDLDEATRDVGDEAAQVNPVHPGRRVAFSIAGPRNH